MIGPALSPHEKALRLEVERFEARFWVRVAMDSSLPGFACLDLTIQRTGDRGRSSREARFANRLAQQLGAVAGFLRLLGWRRGLNRVSLPRWQGSRLGLR